MASIINATTTSGVAVSGDNSGALALQTNNGTTAVTIDTSQNVGIGTTSPAYILDISKNTNGDAAVNITNTNSGANADALVRTYNGLRAGYFGILGSSATGAGVLQPDIAFARGSAGIAICADGGNITFGSTSAERMRIESAGYIDVGCTSNRGGSTFTLSMDSGTTRWAVGPWVSNAGQFYIASSGSTGVYLSSTSATAWSSNSDERVKENLVPITDALNKVDTLRTVTGNYIGDETKTSHAFLIAQDLLKVLPEAVDTSNPEKYGVAYTETIPLLVAAIKELKAELDATKAEVQALKGAK